MGINLYLLNVNFVVLMLLFIVGVQHISVILVIKDKWKEILYQNIQLASFQNVKALENVL